MSGPENPKLSITASRHFTPWLAEQNAAIAFTTYQANKLFLIGTQPNGKMSVFERTLERPMGIAPTDDGHSFALATQYQLYRFDNVIAQGAQIQGGYDALYCPHNSWITGDLDIHDIGLGPDFRPCFVATRFSCLGQVSEGHSFRPIWKPPFISALVAEDRCHLNGMAMRDGAPRYVTAVSRSDVADGWRDHRLDGGIVMNVESDAIIGENLSMPHSPRWHDGTLYLLNAGTGEFGWLDEDSGRFEPICFCPGYARGLAIGNGVAVIGLSLPRGNTTFSGLPLDDRLSERAGEPRCGLLIVDIRSGTIANWLRIDGIVTELFDVALLPGIRCPSAIGFKSDEILHTISLDDRQSR